jgi:outer membrane murein-binding lipoprotein Lpp
MHDSKALASEATAALAVANAKLDGALDQIRQLEALQEVLRLDVEALREGTTTNLGEPNQGTMGGHERPAP